MTTIHTLDQLQDDPSFHTIAMELSKQVALDWPDLSPWGSGESFVPRPTSSAIYIKEGYEVIAILIWTLDFGNTAWIGDVWTHPKHRRQGLYAWMYEKLKEISRERQIPSISCGVAGQNTVSRATHEALGMKASLVFYYEDLCQPSESSCKKETGSGSSAGDSATT